MRKHIAVLFMFITVAAACLAADDSVGDDFVSMVPQGAQTVCSVAHDSTGMTWVGTENGLYAYDGYSFYPCFTSGDISNTRIHALLVHGGIIYLGTDNGLLRYSLETGRYVSTPHCATGEVRALCLWGKDLLVGAAAGLFRFSIGHNSLRKLSYRVGNVYSLLKKNGHLLAGTINGLYEVSGARCVLVPVRQGPQPLVNAMLADGNGGTWIGTEGELYHMDINGRLTPFMALHGNSIKALSSCKGKVFAGTDNGLYSVDENGNVLHMTHDSRDAGTIASNIVWTLVADRYGNLWAGTDNGLSVSHGNGSGRIIRLGTLTGNGDGNCLYCMLREPDGTTWLGGSNGLIRYIPAKNGSWQGGAVAWFRQNSTSYHLTHNRVRSIYRDRQGDIIVCTDHGINLYDRQNGKFRNFIVTDSTGRYTTAWAYDIVQDAQNRYWISSYMGGVFMISKARLTASDGIVEADRHFAAQLQGVHVGRMALDGRGRLWMQLYDKGLDRIDTQSFKVEHVFGGKENSISYIMADNDGNIWLAAPSDVRMYSIADGKLRSFRMTDTPVRRITAMTAVGKQVWCVAGQECMVLNTDGSTARFAVPGGLAPLSLCYDNSTNTAVLGGNDAMAVLAADSGMSSSALPLMLSAITVNGKVWQPENTSAGRADFLELASTQNNITLRLSDIPYAKLRQSVYSYKLEGVDHTWQHFQDGSLDITYNALPHGDYTLRVCEVDGEGRPAAEVYKLKVRILPPWYLSAWAKILYVAVIIGLCIWGMNFYLMRQRLAHERRVRRQVMEQSKARAAFYSGLSRRIKEPLAKIMAQAGVLLHDETDARSSIGMESIRKNSAVISRLVYETLDMSAAEHEPQRNNAGSEATDIVDFCRRVITDVRKDTVESKAGLEFHTDTPILYMSVDLPGFYPPFYLFMCRAVRLAGEGNRVSLSLCVAERHGVVTLRLKIPSYTISEDRLPLVFYRYRTADEAVPDGENINELAVLKDFSEKAGGSFAVMTDMTGGTVFILTLPCGTAVAQPKSSVSVVSGNADKAETAETERSTVQPDLTDSSFLARITAVIEAHMSDSDFNVTRLAAETGIGDKSLYRRIKQMTGHTPVELIRHIRMQKASLLLREGKFSVSEVMYIVGFQNSSYFSKCFSKTYGITPAEYSRKASAQV